jgi:hypothetical protein
MSLHVIISYACWVLYVLTLALFPIYCCYALLLRTRNTLMKTSSRRLKPPIICLLQDGVLFCCLVLSGLVISFYNKIRCNKHWLYCLFHYLLLYVWNLILAHIKECIQFWPKNWVWQVTSRKLNSLATFFVYTVSVEVMEIFCHKPDL